MNKKGKIFITGHTGMVGVAVLKELKNKGYNNFILKTHSELDLTDAAAVSEFFKKEKPDYVIHSAAKVGGIEANIKFPAEFLYENLQIQNNVIWEAKKAKVDKLLFVSSAVIYPVNSPQPMKEDYFMQGHPDDTKAGYAYAKIVGVKLCEYIHQEFGLNFISCAGTNLYGDNDNFNPESAHVIPALIRRIYEAKIADRPEVKVWGNGTARREFLHVSDLAKAIVFMMENYSERQFLNIGTGIDISMKELSSIIKKLVGYQGKLVFDVSKPEGIPKRLFDVSKINDLGWHHKLDFEDGIKSAYEWFIENVAPKLETE